MNGVDVVVNAHARPDEARKVAEEVESSFLCSKTVLPHMMKQKSGKIINISSVAGKKAWETTSALLCL